MLTNSDDEGEFHSDTRRVTVTGDGTGARFTVEVRWCYRPGGKITSLTKRTWGEIYSPLVACQGS